MIITGIMFFIISPGLMHAQQPKANTYFGITVKPIFPNEYLRTGIKEFSNNNISYSLEQKTGFSAGALIRRFISESIALETGLSYVKRNYDLSIKDTTFTGLSEYSIIGYEVPLSAMVFIQTGERIWMNASLGGSIDIYPSDVLSYNPDNGYFRQYSAREQKVNAGLIAGLGVEYRTEKSGTIYLGLNYHRAFSDIFSTMVEYYPQRNYLLPPTSTGRTTLAGDYIAFDIRYYFHENPEKKKKR